MARGWTVDGFQYTGLASIPVDPDGTVETDRLESARDGDFKFSSVMQKLITGAVFFSGVFCGKVATMADTFDWLLGLALMDCRVVGGVR